MRRLAALVLVASLAAGCGSSSRSSGTEPPQQTATQTLTLQLEGGDEGSSAPATPSGAGAAEPQAGAVLEIFVQAAARRKADLMWEALSAPTKQRLGPTLADFEGGAAKRLEDELGAFAQAGAQYRVLLAVRTSPGWAVAAIVGRRTVDGKRQLGAFATALREEDGVYLLELGGPVELAPVVAESATPSTRPAVGVRVTAPAPVEDGAIWIDGAPLEARAAGPDGRHLLVGGRPPQALQDGAHVAVGYARAGAEATAVAWTFDVPGSSG